jgi:cysteine desulfurase family protein
MSSERIYLDNAATTWPKPPEVYAAVDRYQREIGAPAGRGGYRHAQQADQIVSQARQSVARLIGAANSRHVVFTQNGTDALNLAIHGIVRAGDHVVTTVCEHNSVLRPLRTLAVTHDVTVTHVACDAQGYVSPDDIRAALQPNTRLVAVIHGSNVTGAIQPIIEIGAIAHEQGAVFLIDAAQTLGHVPINVDQLGADLLAAPGHKGLLGPLGTGVLYIRPGIENKLQPMRQGGTGSQSHDDRQPETLPDKYESGNHNLPGLAGLAAAGEFFAANPIGPLAASRAQLTARLLCGLADINDVTIHGPPTTENRLDVVSITIDGYDPQEVAAMLDASHGIQCRAGLHCAPRMHASLGTTAGGGTVRFSLGFATTESEIDATLAALHQLATAAV